jgi:hypothetical protein
MNSKEIAAMFVKKVAPVTDDKMPRLADYPELTEAQAKAREIAARRRQLGERQLQLQQSIHEYSSDASGDWIEARAKAILEGREGEVSRATLAHMHSELQSVSDELRALKAADGMHAEVVRGLRRRFSREVASRFLPAHVRAVRGIADALDALVKAQQAEAEVVAQLKSTGADDVLPSFSVLADPTQALPQYAARVRQYVREHE